MTSVRSVQVSAPFARMRHGWFLAGLALGLGGLSWLGWQSGRTDYDPEFNRIYLAISPETNYCPTINELTAIVRQQCRPDQILVIVGGNSILRGEWQPVSDLWSKHLQELLGNRYCVINFAFRGASPTDGGAVVAEVLRHEHPRQIYIADDPPFSSVSPISNGPFRYMFWQAYFRGALEHSEARRRSVAEYKRDTNQKAVFVESEVASWLDSALHYRDLWNQVCFERLCTVPSYLAAYFPKLLTPRRDYRDDEADAYDPAVMAKRNPARLLNAEMEEVRGATRQFYRRAPDGAWQPSSSTFQKMALNYKEAFPEDLIPRTLMLISRSSPYFRLQLKPDEQVRDDQGFKDAVGLWQSAGYSAVEFGRDFTVDDYGDRIHLSTTGGRKLAELVAPKVRAIAERLSYVR